MFPRWCDLSISWVPAWSTASTHLSAITRIHSLKSQTFPLRLVYREALHCGLLSWSQSTCLLWQENRIGYGLDISEFEVRWVLCDWCRRQAHFGLIEEFQPSWRARAFTQLYVYNIGKCVINIGEWNGHISSTDVMQRNLWFKPIRGAWVIESALTRHKECWEIPDQPLLFIKESGVFRMPSLRMPLNNKGVVPSSLQASQESTVWISRFLLLELELRTSNCQR